MIVCVVSSRKNSARVLSFSYFPMNFFVLILLICTMKMAALSQASGKLNGQKSSDQVYVGSTFAVVACNLVLRNPSESELLRSEAFLSLKRTIHEHGLKEFGHVETQTMQTADCADRADCADCAD